MPAARARLANWLDLRDYHPDQVVKTHSTRIVVPPGGRDYQVTVAGDYPAWHQALSGKSDTTLKLYLRRYHLYIEGEGPCTPQEYLVEGHVSQEVIEAISNWIRQ